MPSLRGVLGLVLPLSVVLTACGDAAGPGAEPGAWETQRLDAEIGADQAPLLVTSGEDALVLAVSEDGTVRSHLSAGGAPFEAGVPLETGLETLQVGDVVTLPDGGWFALGSGHLEPVEDDKEFVYDPVGLRSADGLRWERVEVTGFAEPADVSDLQVVDGRLVVAGAYRTATDPSMGGFEARVWTSDDATSFTEATPPGVPPARGYRHESSTAHLVVSGDRLLAAGRVGDQAAVWTTDDAARTWQRVDDPVLADTYVVSGLAVVGDTVLAGVGEGPVTALRSTDHGATWTPVEALPVTGEDAGWAPVWSDRSRFWTLTGVDDTSWSEPEVCYADLSQCGKDPGPRIVASENGADEWNPVELPGEPGEIAGTDDGRVLVLGQDGDGLVVHTLPAGAAPPEAPPAPEPTTIDLVTVAEGETPEVGTRYHAQMYLHCGMDWFWFGDGTWRRTDGGPDVETGAGDGWPEDWPMHGQMLYGYAELTDADHLEYVVEDEVVATYERADGAPGCD